MYTEQDVLALLASQIDGVFSLAAAAADSQANTIAVSLDGVSFSAQKEYALGLAKAIWLDGYALALEIGGKYGDSEEGIIAAASRKPSPRDIQRKINEAAKQLANEDFAQRLGDHLNTQIFEAFGPIEEEAAQILREEIFRASPKGLQPETVVRRVRKRLEERGLSGLKPYRIRTLYATLSSIAYNLGKYKAETSSPSLWGWRYLTARDERVRPNHAAAQDITLPKTHDFWQYMYPPNGYNCRCAALALYGPPKKGIFRWVGGAVPDDGFEFGPGDIAALSLSWDETKHPRVSAGSKGGGQFTNKDGGSINASVDSVPNDWSGTVEWVENGEVIAEDTAENARKALEALTDAERADLKNVTLRLQTDALKEEAAAKSAAFWAERDAEVKKRTEAQRLGNRPGGVDWKEPPETLYHATFATDKVLTEGFRTDEKVQGSVLGGSNHTGVSFTDYGTASRYRDGLEYARRAAQGQFDLQDAKTLDTIADDWGVPRDFVHAEAKRLRTDYPESESKASFRLFQSVAFRGQKFPLFMSGDWPQTLRDAAEPPRILAVDTVKTREGLTEDEITYHASENEWRIHAPDKIRIIGPIGLSISFSQSGLRSEELDRFAESWALDWNESLHPRRSAGEKGGGQFVGKDGASEFIDESRTDKRRGELGIVTINGKTFRVPLTKNSLQVFLSRMQALYGIEKDSPEGKALRALLDDMRAQGLDAPTSELVNKHLGAYLHKAPVEPPKPEPPKPEPPKPEPPKPEPPKPDIIPPAPAPAPPNHPPIRPALKLHEKPLHEVEDHELRAWIGGRFIKNGDSGVMAFAPSIAKPNSKTVEKLRADLRDAGAIGVDAQLLSNGKVRLYMDKLLPQQLPTIVEVFKRNGFAAEESEDLHSYLIYSDSVSVSPIRLGVSVRRGEWKPAAEAGVRLPENTPPKVMREIATGLQSATEGFPVKVTAIGQFTARSNSYGQYRGFRNSTAEGSIELRSDLVSGKLTEAPADEAQYAARKGQYGLMMLARGDIKGSEVAAVTRRWTFNDSSRMAESVSAHEMGHALYYQTPVSAYRTVGDEFSDNLRVAYKDQHEYDLDAYRLGEYAGKSGPHEVWSEIANARAIGREADVPPKLLKAYNDSLAAAKRHAESRSSSNP